MPLIAPTPAPSTPRPRAAVPRLPWRPRRGAPAAAICDAVCVASIPCASASAAAAASRAAICCSSMPEARVPMRCAPWMPEAISSVPLPRPPAAVWARMLLNHCELPACICWRRCVQSISSLLPPESRPGPVGPLGRPDGRGAPPGPLPAPPPPPPRPAPLPGPVGGGGG